MLRGKSRVLEKHTPINIDVNASLHNRFDIEVIDSKTGKIKQKAQAENVICNSWWTRAFLPAATFNYIHYGTGAGTPSATDTSLFTFLGAIELIYTIDGYTSNGFSEGVFWVKRKIQLAETVAVGAVLTEVGIGWSATASTLVTHAMLKDMNGNQISITKTDTDIINIYATVFVHWTEPDSNLDIQYHAEGWNGASSIHHSGGLFELAGCVYGYGYGTEAALPTYAQLTNSNVSRSVCAAKLITKTYDVNTKTITLTSARFAVAEGNIINATKVLLGCGYHNSLIYHPFLTLKVGGSWYPGTDIVGEAVGTGDGNLKDFKTAFPFIKTGAKIYVNGVERTSGVTIDLDKPFISTQQSASGMLFMRLIDGKFRPWGTYTSQNNDYMQTMFSPNNYIYNSEYEKNGITSMVCSPSLHLYCTNDETGQGGWVDLGVDGAGGVANTVLVPEQYRNYKYWNLYAGSGYQVRFTRVLTNDYNVHFDTAPSQGDIITMDYTSGTIAKDVNHVFDLTVTITIGEKTS